MQSNRPYSISPGNITSCWRGVYYEKKKTEKPPVCQELLEMFDLFRKLGNTGSAFQRYLTNSWRERGVLVSTEDWLPNNEWNIRGRFDAICKVDGRSTLIEIKGAGHELFEMYQAKNQALPAHRTQVLTYFLVMRHFYDDLAIKVLYISRKTRKCYSIDIETNEEELHDLVGKFEQLHHHLENDILPECAGSLENHLINGKKVVSMTAMTCRYHSLCAGDNDWYAKALSQRESELAVE